MGSWSLGDMMDKILGYDDILNRFKFIHKGSGDKPWSINFEHEDGRTIETRNSEWTAYDSEKKELMTNNTPESLNRYLLSFMNKEELIEYVVSNIK